MRRTRGCGRSRRRRRSSARRRRSCASSARRRRGSRRAGRASSRGRGRSHLVAVAAVLVDLVAVAGALLAGQRRVGDLDDVALRGAGERGGSSRVWRMKALTRPVAEKSIAGRGRADRSGAAGRLRHGRSSALPDQARVAVGRDRVELRAVADLADDQRRKQLLVAGLDAQRVGDALGVEEGARAEEVGRTTAALAAVLEQLGPGGAAHRRSAAALRKSSGSTAQISRSKGSPSRSPSPARVSTWRQPSPATVRFAASLKAGISP